jgi:hypothetical protein
MLADLLPFQQINDIRYGPFLTCSPNRIFLFKIVYVKKLIIALSTTLNIRDLFLELNEE